MKSLLVKFEGEIVKTITICGSMKYDREMPKIALNLETKNGFNVLQCVYNFENKELTTVEMETLKKAHYDKIKMSDAIYVVDINNYIGNSTKEEIKYAKKLGKGVILHSKYNI